MKHKFLSTIIIIIVIYLDIVFIFSDKQTFSYLENRYLTQFPKFNVSKILTGKYMNNLTEYLKDQFPYRDKFMGLKTEIDKITLKTKINGVYLGKDNYLLEEYNSIKDKDKLIKIFNNFSDNNDINLFLLLSPTSISINTDKLPSFSTYESQLEDIDYIYDNIKFNSINVYNTLKQHNINDQMFYYLDHHWTTDGAYYIYQQIITDLGYKYYSKESFNVEIVTNDFYGTLYSKTNDYTRKPDNIKIYNYNNELEIYYTDNNRVTDSLYEYDYLNKKDKYSVFLDNNHSLIVITNKTIESNKELVVIKDSYANSVIPFLVNHYKKVHVIDPRYYTKNISEYINNNKMITDGLILYNINTIESDLGIYKIK